MYHEIHDKMSKLVYFEFLFSSLGITTIREKLFEIKPTLFALWSRDLY